MRGPTTGAIALFYAALCAGEPSGEADTIIPVQDSIARIRQAAATPSPQLVILPRAGHSFTVTAKAIPQLAKDYPDVVLRWIKSLSR